ncbi:hypothetical protein CANCADRAFT_42560 [Tortispora caseinolytica NRRL Y-17796]|uniref:Uncharacterized protein n=1 Tax=Tortispora caseinolytica NRRL Y-17796 TaxID=767744 RepID=A0A1E4TJH7_9ASCO|nr:hypothetical protein CANCADRAFT_42560 [Tortispora caseinolytica NRRL Y-17796]
MTTQFEDITARFTSLCADLDETDLVKSPHFSLFQSVTAIEIGEPKMDSGLLHLPAFDCSAPRSYGQVLTHLNYLAAAELLWHQGYSLCQVVFPSRYIFYLLNTYSSDVAESGADWTDQPTGRLLRAYCLATIHTIRNFISLIEQAGFPLFYDEEDVQTNTFGFSLCTHTLDSQASTHVKSYLSETISWFNDCDLDIASELKSAILSHLQFRLNCLNFSDCLFDPSTAAESLAGISSTLQQFAEHVSNSIDLSEPFPESVTYAVQSRLSSCNPPRPLPEIPDWTVTVQGYQHFIADLSLALKLVNEYLMTQFQPSSSLIVRQALLEFSLQESHQHYAPGSISRTALTRILTRVLVGTDYHTPNERPDLLDNELRVYIGKHVSNMFAAGNSAEPKALEMIQQQLSNVIDKDLTVLCLNQCRQRQNFAHLIVEWDSLHADILQSEGAGTPDPHTGMVRSLSQYLLIRKVETMLYSNLLGFNLTIYEDYEWPEMYLHAMILSEELYNSIARLNPDFDRQNVFYLKYKMEYYGMIAAVCRGMAAMSKALILQGLVPSGPQERTWYNYDLSLNTRMKPFNSVSWPGPLTKQKVSEFFMSQEVSFYIGQAKHSLGLALKQLSLIDSYYTKAASAANIRGTGEVTKLHKESMKQIKYSVVSANLSLTTLEKATESGTELKLSVNTKGHPFFPVMCLSPVK